MYYRCMYHRIPHNFLCSIMFHIFCHMYMSWPIIVFLYSFSLYFFLPCGVAVRFSRF